MVSAWDVALPRAFLSAPPKTLSARISAAQPMQPRPLGTTRHTARRRARRGRCLAGSAAPDPEGARTSFALGLRPRSLLGALWRCCARPHPGPSPWTHSLESRLPKSGPTRRGPRSPRRSFPPQPSPSSERSSPRSLTQTHGSTSGRDSTSPTDRGAGSDTPQPSCLRGASDPSPRAPSRG